ncbi:MAG: GNAT family N-acetyltransferase [Lutisporaceae bacterium]
MLTINMQERDLCFKDITKDDLDEVLKLYNQNEINMYATGIDRAMSLEDITQKYLEVLVNSHEFFVGIFVYDHDSAISKMIGVVKGRIDYDNNEEAWISSILIDNSFQRKGIGSKAVEYLIERLRGIYDIKSILIGTLSGNIIGKKFWKNLGFSYIRTIDKYIKLNSKKEDFIIMRKDLYISH